MMGKQGASVAPLSVLQTWFLSVRWYLPVAAVLSVIASIAGLGLSYEEFSTPRASLGNYHLIHGDGWIEHGARIRFFNLAARGNRVDLVFNPWRPAGMEPARMQVRLCGELVSEFAVSAETPSQRIYLTAACEPREIQFAVLNPFVPSETDRRELGAQLLSATVSSPLGVPLLPVYILLESWAAVYVLTLLLSLAVFVVGTGRIASAGMLAIAPLMSTWMLSSADNLDLLKIFGFWLLCISVIAGILLAALSMGRTAPAERETWNPVIPAPLALGAILVVAAALRAYGLHFGLPSNFHPDEVPKVNAIMRMVDSGTLDPDYFLHPSLLLYSTYAMNVLFHAFNFVPFAWLGIPEDFRSTAYFAGRTVSMLAGIWSVALVYFIGRRLFSQSAGLFGAAILAVLPLHVTCSRYLKEDALLTFWVLLTVLTVVKAVQEDRKDLLWMAGFLAGVATSTKYSGLLCGAIVCGAPWLRSGRWMPDLSFIRPTCVAIGFMPCGFLLCSPYALINHTEFVRDFSAERRHMMRGHTIPIDPWSQYWMYHFWRSIIPGMSLPTTLLGVFGAGLLLWRRRMEDLFVIALVLLFYMPAEWVKAKPEPQPERYIFPCLPFLAILAGEAVRTLAAQKRAALAAVLFFAALIFPLRRTLQISSEIITDTRIQMAQWMRENIPPGSKVYMDWKPYGPRFFNDEFEVTHIQRATILQKLDPKVLRESGYDYLVLSGLFYERYFTQPLSLPVLREQIRSVFEEVPVVKQIAPFYGTYGFHNPTLTLFSLKSEDFQRLDRERAMKKEGKLDRTSNEERAQFRWRGAGE